MKYKKIFKEAFEEYNLLFDDRYAIDTDHEIKRFFDKNRFLQKSGTNEFKKTILWIISNGAKKIISTYKDSYGHFAIYSKSTGYSAIVDWRKDSYGINDKKHAIIITLPPQKPNANALRTKTGDVKIIVETQLEQLARSKQKICENKDTIDNIEFNNGFYIVFHEGKLYDITIRNYILVD